MITSTLILHCKENQIENIQDISSLGNSPAVIEYEYVQ